MNMTQLQTYLQVTMTIMFLMMIVSLMYDNQMRVESTVNEMSRTLINIENERRTSFANFTRKD